MSFDSIGIPDEDEEQRLLRGLALATQFGFPPTPGPAPSARAQRARRGTLGDRSLSPTPIPSRRSRGGSPTSNFPKFFPGRGISLQPAGFEIGVRDFLQIDQRNVDIARRNRELFRKGGDKSERKKEVAAGRRTVEGFVSPPNLGRRKLTAGGTILFPGQNPDLEGKKLSRANKRIQTQDGGFTFGANSLGTTAPFGATRRAKGIRRREKKATRKRFRADRKAEKVRKKSLGG